MSFGLLIQGPLLSVGRTGKTAGVSSGAATDNDVVHYDCVKNIHNIISDYGDLFDEIVISTWKNQNLKYRKVSKEKICYFDDDLTEMSNKSSSNSYVAINNMLRQFKGTYLGLNEFNDVHYIIKIRTDIYIDLRAVLLQATTNCVDEIILVPALYRSDQYIEDFYFAGTYSTMHELFYSLIKNQTYFSESPHCNIWLKYAHERYKQEIFVNECFYHDTSFSLIGHFLIFEYMRRNIFRQLSVDIFTEMCWRGENFNDDHKRNIVMKYKEIGSPSQSEFFKYFAMLSNAVGCNIQNSICLIMNTAITSLKNVVRRVIR